MTEDTDAVIAPILSVLLSRNFTHASFISFFVQKSLAGLDSCKDSKDIFSLKTLLEFV